MHVPESRSASKEAPHIVLPRSGNYYSSAEFDPWIYDPLFTTGSTEAQKQLWRTKWTDIAAKKPTESASQPNSTLRKGYVEKQLSRKFREVAIVLDLGIRRGAHLTPVPLNTFSLFASAEVSAIFRQSRASSEYSYTSHTDVSHFVKMSERSAYVPDEAATARSYHLNVELKPYQQQTVEWMIAEENDEYGFHRHFFKPVSFVSAATGVASRNWYSNEFQQLYLDEDLPRRHGGIVAEEMVRPQCLQLLCDFVFSIQLHKTKPFSAV